MTYELGKAVLAVEDQGLSISEEAIPRLFDYFHCGINVVNIVAIGLGLVIVKKCVDIHKDEIFVTS